MCKITRRREVKEETRETVREVETTTGAKYSKADLIINDKVDHLDTTMANYVRKAKKWMDDLGGMVDKLEGRTTRLEEVVFKIYGEDDEEVTKTTRTKETTTTEISGEDHEERHEKGCEVKHETECRTVVEETKFVPFRANGPGRAYKYWDYKTKTYGLKSDLWAAKQAGNGEYTPIWVWYVDGNIDHILDKEEIKKYTP